MLLDLILAVTAAALSAYFNRLRGSDASLRPLLFKEKGFCIAMIAMLPSFLFVYSEKVIWVAALLFVLFHAFTQLMYRPSWGEYFPSTRDTFNEVKDRLVRAITSFLVGYKYDAAVADNDLREVIWKRTAFGLVRHGFYGLPLAGLICYGAGSLLPLFMHLFACMLIGALYLRAFLNYHGKYDPVERAEQTSGAAYWFVMTLGIAGG